MPPLVAPLLMTDPAPAGSVPYAVVVDATRPGRPTYSAIAFWRGEQLRLRATCLVCGVTETADAPHSSAPDNELALKQFGSDFANAHDGTGCYPTFTTERDDIALTLEEIVTAHLGDHADEWLDAMQRIALDGEGARWVVTGSSRGAASLDASLAYLAAMHRSTPHSALVAVDQALRAQCPDGAGLTTFTTICPELGHGARRWWVFSHKRTLVFQTVRAVQPGKVGITVGEEAYRTNDGPNADTYHIEPYSLIVAVQLAAL
jgi:hypothetical protein